MLLHPKRLLALTLVAATLAVLGVSTVSAQQPVPSDDEVNAIASQLFCPVCENTPLDVCPTEACHDWRELIRQMLAEGKSSQEIQQYFVEHYGARVLSKPPLAGLNWLVYVVPPLVFVVGVFLLVRSMRVWRQPNRASIPPADADANPVQEDAYMARIEEELRKRK
jgi:cytochrome c-type biogenesis protein CcmH